MTLKGFVDEISNKYFIYIAVLVLVVLKIPYMQIPYYWDEAWSYATAVLDMHDNGISILPGDVNYYFTKGHPLLYYFTAASWMKFFGTSLLSGHIFALIISCTSLFALYKLSLNIFNPTVARIIILFMIAQSYFLVQSTLLLPEIFLLLFTILSINAYFTKKCWQFAFFSSCVVLTKETGLVLIFTFFFDKIILSRFFAKGQTTKIFLKEVLVLFIPVAIICAFFILQKIRLGWFFYPEHIHAIVSDYKEILKRIGAISFQFFWRDGRLFLIFLTIVSIVYAIRKKYIEVDKLHYIFFSLIFILFYLIFAGANFFTGRYLLSILPFYLLIPTYFLVLILHDKKWSLYTTTFILFVLFAFNTFSASNEGDTSLAFINTVKIHKETINYCEVKKWQEKQICTGFLMTYNLRMPKLGYLNNPSKPFTNVNSESDKEIYIYYSNEYDPAVEEIKKNQQFILEKRFEKGKAWVEIYVKK